MFSGRNMANYPLIIPVTPSYLEHCYRVLDKPNIWYNIFVVFLCQTIVFTRKTISELYTTEFLEQQFEKCPSPPMSIQCIFCKFDEPEQ